MVRILRTAVGVDLAAAASLAVSILVAAELWQRLPWRRPLGAAGALTGQPS